MSEWGHLLQNSITDKGVPYTSKPFLYQIYYCLSRSIMVSRLFSSPLSSKQSHHCLPCFISVDVETWHYTIMLERTDPEGMESEDKFVLARMTIVLHFASCSISFSFHCSYRLYFCFCFALRFYSSHLFDTDHDCLNGKSDENTVEEGN